MCCLAMPSMSAWCWPVRSLPPGPRLTSTPNAQAPYAFGLPGLMDGPPAPGKMSHSVYAHVSAVVVVAFVVLQTLNLSAGVSLALAAVAMIAWVVACVCGSPAFCAQVNAV